MSKPRFKMVAYTDTLAHATTIKNSISNQLAGLDIFEQHSLVSGNDPDSGLPGLIAEWRFNSSADRDTLRDWAKDQIQNNAQVKVWVQTATLTWHLCTHDEMVPENCSTNNFGSWSK